MRLDESTLKALEGALKPTELLVIKALAERADTELSCTVKVKDLAEQTGKSQIMVRKTTANLRDKELLEIIRQQDGEGATRANVYRLRLDSETLERLTWESQRPHPKRHDKRPKKEEKVKSMDNWGRDENEVMKGYMIFALETLKEERPEITEEDIQNVLLKINRATDTLTANEAHRYYLNSRYQ